MQGDWISGGYGVLRVVDMKEVVRVGPDTGPGLKQKAKSEFARS